MPFAVQVLVLLATGLVAVSFLGLRAIRTPWNLERAFMELKEGMETDEVKQLMGPESESAEGILLWRTQTTGGPPEEGIRRVQGTQVYVTYAAWFKNGRLVRKERFRAPMKVEELINQAPAAGEKGKSRSE